MYCGFFGFSEKPFDITPDPKFLYLTPGHREALSALIYGIRERRGFIVLVGEVGTGKTTLLNALLTRLDQKTRVAFIFNTKATFNQMLNMALTDFGLAQPDRPLPKVEAVRRLNEFAIRQLARAGNVVLLVDEAQNLDRASMENLRLLSNLETRKHKLIQIVLSGQPELDQKLKQPELRQLAQRITIKRYVTPLREEETYNYLQHRLNVANYNGSPIFSRKAQQIIWEYSGGIPRKINMLCDNALLIGYATREKKIKTTAVEEVIRDLSCTPFPGSREEPITPTVEHAVQRSQKTSRPWFPRVAGLAAALFVLLAAGLLLGKLWLGEKETGPIRISTRIKADTTDRQDLTNPVPAQDMEADRSVTNEKPTIHREITLSDILDQKVRRKVTVPQNPLEPEIYGEEGKAQGLSEDTALSSGDVKTREAQQMNAVVVKTGDNLYRIITRAYGKYDRAILEAVLRENPEILSPDRITVGQTIKLPKE